MTEHPVIRAFRKVLERHPGAVLLILGKKGERDAEKLIGTVRASVEENGGKVDYIVLNDRKNLQPLEKADQPAILAAAVYFGTTRLIDNVFLG